MTHQNPLWPQEKSSVKSPPSISEGRGLCLKRKLYAGPAGAASSIGAGFISSGFHTPMEAEGAAGSRAPSARAQGEGKAAGAGDTGGDEMIRAGVERGGGADHLPGVQSTSFPGCPSGEMLVGPRGSGKVSRPAAACPAARPQDKALSAVKSNAMSRPSLDGIRSSERRGSCSGQVPKEEKQKKEERKAQLTEKVEDLRIWNQISTYNAGPYPSRSVIIAGALLGLLWESFYVVRLIDEQYGVGGSRGRWVAPIITRVLMWAGCLTVLATASFNRTVGFAYRHAGTIATVQIAAWNMENIVSPLTGMTSKVNEIAWVEDHQYKYFANPVYTWCLRLLLWSFTQNFYPLLFSPHRGPHEDRMLLWGYTFNQFLKCMSMLMTFLFPPEGSSMDPRTIPVFFVITFPLSVLMSFFLMISIRPRWLPGIEARDPTRDGGLYGRLLVLVHNPKIVSNFTNFTFNIGLLFSLLLAIDAFGVRVDETGFWRFTILLLTVSSYRFGVFIKDSVIRELLSNLLTEEGAKVVIEGIFYSGRNRGKKGTPDTVDVCDAPAPPLRDGDSEAPPDGFFATGGVPPSMCETHGSFVSRGRGQRDTKSVTQKAAGAGGLPTLLEVPVDGEELLSPSPGGSRLFERPRGSLRRSTHGAAATNLVKRAPSRASRASRLGGTQRHSEFGNDMTPLETILCMGARTATLMPPKMTIPKNHLVTAIFCDIVGYTTMSSECDPADVFDMLHVFFNKLDLLLPVCRCFKYQTVGDAYVAISNYDGNMTGEEHSMAALRFAFAMIHVAGTLREPRSGTQGVQIRVGIHSGPLAACVLGVERPALTLIGDTINTASRMESNSLAAHVRMSDETYRLLPKVVRQDLAPEREDLEIKGKGTMTTHLVSGIGLRMCDRVWDWVPQASTGEMSCEGSKSGSGSGGGATRPVTLSNSRGFEAGADPRSATPVLRGTSDLSPTASAPRAVNAIAPDMSQ